MFEILFAQSGLSLERLKTFHDIVAAGGITAAAGDDSNRQSQFSRQLKELEKYFGTELIKRGRGAMKLTTAGRRLYEITGHLLAALEEFRAACSNQPLELTIGAGESLIQWWLMPRLAPLAGKQPHAGITFRNLTTDDIRQQVIDGDLDFGVVTRHEPHRAIAAVPLGRLVYGLYVPTRCLSGRSRGADENLIGKLPLAVLDGSSRTQEALRQAAQKQGVRLDIRLRFSSYPQLAHAVQTLGVAAIMPTLAGGALDEKQVRCVSLPFLKPLARDVSLIWNSAMAKVRPGIESYSRILPGWFRMR